MTVASAMARGGAFHGEQAVFSYQEEERYPLVQHPVLIISGTGDVLHPRLDNVKGLFPRSKTMVFPDVDAFATLEKPEEFARAVLDFLKNPGI